MSSNAISTSGSTYTVAGTVKNQANNEGIQDLHVLVYDEDVLKDDFLGIAVTDVTGAFSLSFDASKFRSIVDWRPDLYFIVKDAGTVLLTTKDQPINDADVSTPPINLLVSLAKDKFRSLIKETPAPGWIGGFLQNHDPSLAYPPQSPTDKDITPPDLSSLKVNKNRKNKNKLDRQQKVLWPEFSWNSEPENEGDKKRCYQMFAPDISRLGYDKEGKIYSVICPQQGVCVPHLGCMNVEVTVTGSRGWVDEDNKRLAGDMSVVGTIWFSPSGILNNPLVKSLMDHFVKHGLPFPSTKEDAIIIKTHKVGDPNQVLFPLTTGLVPEAVFKIPDFAMHNGIAWSNGHLQVQIGEVTKLTPPADKSNDPEVVKGYEKVNKFNQLVVDIFNMGAGHMLTNGNVLTWNVWFNAPEKINRDEWEAHTETWRKSIDADHGGGSPDGEGTSARYYDGTPFKPLKSLLIEELPRILEFLAENIPDLHKEHIA